MSAPRPIVQMIWTRPIDGVPMAGRLRVAHAVREAVREAAEVREHIMAPAIRAGARAVLGAGWAWARSLVRGPLLPLQCLLYADGREVRRALAAIDPQASVVYLDGVRTFALLRVLRRRHPGVRIVVDLDDLMSRRMALLRASRLPLSPGYLTNALPPVLVRWLTGGLSQWVLRYEAATLPKVEAAITELADEMVLLSSADLAQLPGAGPAERHAILPGVALTNHGGALKPGPIRFIFAGTDALTQNRLTIDYLIELWRRHRPAAELVLIGRLQRNLSLPPGVRALGYIADIADAYDGHSVLLTPSFLRGGVKTKVLEAFAHGTAVIGNSVTFEAMPINGYPLVVDDEEALLALIRNPEQHRALFEDSARFGLEYVRHVHAPGDFAQKWRKVLGLAPAGAPVLTGVAG